MSLRSLRFLSKHAADDFEIRTLYIPDLEIEGVAALCFTMMARTREENKSQKHTRTRSRNSIIPHCSTRNLSDSSGGLYSIYLAIIPAGTWLSLYMCIVYTFLNVRLYIEAICSIRFIIRDAYLRRSISPLTLLFQSLLVCFHNSGSCVDFRVQPNYYQAIPFQVYSGILYVMSKIFVNCRVALDNICVYVYS
jgi:hypothetical protein